MVGLLTGVDMLEVKRLETAILRHGDRFLKRVYTNRELDQIKGNLPSLAARFAGKEAVAKALATGIGPVSWLEIEILRGPAREPVLHLFGEAKQLAEQRKALQTKVDNGVATRRERWMLNHMQS